MKILQKKTFKSSVRFIGTLLLFHIIFASVAITNVAANLVFFVEPILPESQNEAITTYFDLNLNEGAEETLGLTLINTSDETIEIEVDGYTAFTNVNGVVEYARNNEELNPTLTHQLGDLLETPDNVILEPGEETTVFVYLTMPSEPFEGLLAGGLRIQTVEDDNEAVDENLAIRNVFSYVVAVVVSNTRTTVTPELELLDVFADHLNFRNVFSVHIENYTPTFVNQLEVEAQIRLKDEEDVLYEAHQMGMQMAPNSDFKFPIPLEGDRFVSGDYTLSLVARSGDREWSWEQDFHIDQSVSRELNRQDVTIEDTSWHVIAAVIFIILLLIIIIYLIVKQKKLARVVTVKEAEKTDS